MAAILVFMLTSLEIVVERKNCLRGELYFGCNVIQNPALIYRRIPKIRPGTYTFQRPFLKGLFLEGLIFGGAYLRREICVLKSIGLAL